MACKISWTLRAGKTYEANINYLEQFWTEKEIAHLLRWLRRNLTISRSKKDSNIRFTLVHRRVALIYRFKPRTNEIELLVFWNTYQNPRKLKV